MEIFYEKIRSKYTPKRTIFQNFPKREHTPEPLAMQYNTSEKIIRTPLLNPVMYAHLSLFESKQIYVIKDLLFPILKRSTSIHKNNPALVASIVLHKHYFHGICAFSKKKTVNFTRSCALAQALNSPILRFANVKKTKSHAS